MMALMDDSAPTLPDRPDPAGPDDPAPDSGTSSQQRLTGRAVVLGLALGVVVAASSWLLGHLPWVLAGFSWSTTDAAPVGSSSEGLAGVRLTIPLVAAFLPSLVAFTVIGAVAATLVPLVLTTRAAGHRVPAVVVSLVALVLTMSVVTLMARSSIEAHAADAFAGDPRVLRGLVLVVAGTTVLGAVLGALASLQIGFLPLAAAVVAGQLPVWVGGFLVDHDHGPDALRTAEQVTDWLVFATLAVAFVLSVRRSAAWTTLWPVAIAILWVATPFRIMTVQLAGQLRPSSGLPDTLPDILQGGLDVFRASFWDAPQTRWPWLLALAVGLVWLVVERIVLATRNRSPETERR